MNLMHKTWHSRKGTQEGLQLRQLGTKNGAKFTKSKKNKKWYKTLNKPNRKSKKNLHNGQTSWVFFKGWHFDIGQNWAFHITASQTLLNKKKSEASCLR